MKFFTENKNEKRKTFINNKIIFLVSSLTIQKKDGGKVFESQ